MVSDPVRILITGDLCPHNRIEKLALKSDFKAIYNDFIDEFEGNDLIITDLECPLTLAESSRPKTGPHQKAHPSSIEVLKYGGINLAAMANNHIMDYDTQGVKDTLELLEDNGISTVGIGRSPDEARRPFSVTIKGKRIAVLNFADNEFLSTPDGSYHCNPIDPVNGFYDIKSARENHDYIILIMHAGNEFYELPSPRTKSLYRYFIDQGADMVVSHHTHVFSGYEIYNSKPIFYGLGNFIYDWPGKLNSDWNKGYIVKIEIGENADFRIVPLTQCNENPGLKHLTSEENDEFNSTIERLNLIIADDRQLEIEFQKYCHSVNDMYDAFIEPYFGKYITALRKRGYFPRLMSKRKRLLLLNITRCESHREVVLRMLAGRGGINN
jgi:hypothetical protein